MLTEVEGRPAAAPVAWDIPSRLRRLRWPAATVVGSVVLFCCALREARAMTVQADGASIVLQAWAMLHGNVLLHGWTVADLPLYTTELPEYMLVELVRGMRPDVVAVCAALTYTLLVLLAAVVARGQARGREGLARAAVTVAIMLGPALSAATVLLNNPDHTGTAVPVLVALVLIDKGGRRPWVPAAVAVVLGWALVGDPLVLLIGVVPLLVVCGTRSVAALARRRLPLREAWYELSLAAAAVAAFLGASAFERLLRAAGGFTIGSAGNQRFVPSGAMAKNAWATVQCFLHLFSADFFGMRVGAGLVITGIHLVAAAAVVAATVAGLRRIARGPDLVTPLLATAIVANIAAYAFTYQVSLTTAREIAPVFALGAALAGRLLAGPLVRDRLEWALAIGLAAALVAAVPPLLAGPVPPRESALASWLEHHGLRQGVAGFWQANSVTLDSGGQVTMRAVRDYGARGLAPYPWELNQALLDSRASDVTFLVATAPRSQAGSTVTAAEATAMFGPPYRVYRYQQYVILVWRANLLTDLARR